MHPSYSSINGKSQVGSDRTLFEKIEVSSLTEMFSKQQAAFRTDPFPTFRERINNLKQLDELTRNHLGEIKSALSKDFGCRSEDETLVTEVMGVLKSISYTKRHLKGWMKSQSRAVDVIFKPGTARVVPQPLGVVGIVAPWNFPFGLVIKPIISALAAGNRVMIKPSEFAPNTAALLDKLLSERFDESNVCIIQGDGSVAKAFVEIPFDHLLFTGSTSIGKAVMSAAAKNLTSLTLELGGKSPVIIDEKIDMTRATKSIVTGKLLNCGQTCTAPDYVLLPSGRLHEFVDSFSSITQKMYPAPISNPDYTSIINNKHFDRLSRLRREVIERGVKIVDIYPQIESHLRLRKFVPMLVINPPHNTKVMEEEIFGPLLPVITYNTLDEAIAFVNDRPRPLALYIFTTDKGVEETILRNTISGGVAINETLLHYAQESLPFGGVGNSGFGAYHGKTGFTTFSHIKPVFSQSRVNGLDLLRAPYNKTSRRLIDFILKTA